jgi:hypothetical protein
MNQSQEDRDTRLLGETKRLRAIDSQADPVKGFAERVEEMEKCAALPGFQINLNGAGTVLLEHSFIVYAPETNVAEASFPVRSAISESIDRA